MRISLLLLPRLALLLLFSIVFAFRLFFSCYILQPARLLLLLLLPTRMPHGRKTEK